LKATASKEDESAPAGREGLGEQKTSPPKGRPCVMKCLISRGVGGVGGWGDFHEKDVQSLKHVFLDHETLKSRVGNNNNF